MSGLGRSNVRGKIRTPLIAFAHSEILLKCHNTNNIDKGMNTKQLIKQNIFILHFTSLFSNF